MTRAERGTKKKFNKKTVASLYVTRKLSCVFSENKEEEEIGASNIVRVFT